MSDIEIIDPRNTPVAPELQISWDDCWKSPHAMWVICQKTQRTLYANPAAVAANGNRPPTDILNTDISVLWEDESLRKLTEQVNNANGWLTDHTNQGYRFQPNPEPGGVLWLRVPYEFNVDYLRINYMGVPARFEHVKNAVPLR